MCQADPAADLSAVGSALKGTAVVQGSGGTPHACRCASSTRARTRRSCSTARSSPSCATRSGPGAGSAYEKVERRAGRLGRRHRRRVRRRSGGVVTDCGIGLAAVGAEHYCSPAAEAALIGKAADRGEPRRRRAGRRPSRASPNADQRGPADYKKHLATRTHPARAAPRRPSQPGSLTMQVTITVNGVEQSRATSSRACCSCTSSATSCRCAAPTGAATPPTAARAPLWVDDEPVKSCTMLAVQADGKAITTVEGLAKGGELDPIQKGFMECHGLQCGYCTPGMMMAGRALLDQQPAPHRGRDPRRHLRQHLPLHRLQEHRRRDPVGRRQPRHRPTRGDRMTAVEDAVPLSAAGNPIGFGRMHRKEDVRFLRGEGNYVDDVQLPGMLYGAILRSPYAHAQDPLASTPRRPRRCPASRPSSPARCSRPLGLAWMPTLSYDTQAVLATDKVRFQGQEVAFVVAESRYIAQDALELIDVDYEPLPAVADAKKALDADAPVIRDDKEGKTDNHIYDWEAGNKEEHRGRVRRRRGRRHRGHPLPARAPGADGDVRLGRAHGPGHRQAQALDDHAGAARAPHGLRARRRPARAEHPGDQPGHRRRLRQQGADLPRLRLLDRRLHRHRQAGEVDGGPRREPHVDRVRPRLPHEGVDRLDEARARSSPSRSTCSPTTARSTASRSRRSTRPASSTSSPARTTTRPRTAT